MAAHLGAHEVLDLHEVLLAEIDAINMMQLVRAHVQDLQLASIMDKQLDFMVHGYNTLVSVASQSGMQRLIPYYAPQAVSPTYGLDRPQEFSPQMSNMNAINDRDVSSIVLGIHKSGALKKAQASLECADPFIRRTLLQSSNNCTELAYEVWNYMNSKGYYQVPTLKDVTTETLTHSYRGTAAGPFYSTGHIQQDIPIGYFQ